MSEIINIVKNEIIELYNRYTEEEEQIAENTELKQVKVNIQKYLCPDIEGIIYSYFNPYNPTSEEFERYIELYNESEDETGKRKFLINYVLGENIDDYEILMDDNNDNYIFNKIGTERYIYMPSIDYNNYINDNGKPRFIQNQLFYDDYTGLYNDFLKIIVFKNMKEILKHFYENYDNYEFWDCFYNFNLEQLTDYIIEERRANAEDDGVHPDFIDDFINDSIAPEDIINNIEAFNEQYNTDSDVINYSSEIFDYNFILQSININEDRDTIITKHIKLVKCKNYLMDCPINYLYC